MILANLGAMRRPDHLRLEDFFDNEVEQAAFERHLDALTTKLVDAQQLVMLEQWRISQ